MAVLSRLKQQAAIAMGVFAISFRIHKDQTYEARYNSLVDAISDAAGDNNWKETTSFHVVETAQESIALADALVANSQFRTTTDLLVVINLAGKGYAIRGVNSDKRLVDMLKAPRG